MKNLQNKKQKNNNIQVDTHIAKSICDSNRNENNNEIHLMYAITFIKLLQKSAQCKNKYNFHER